MIWRLISLPVVLLILILVAAAGFASFSGERDVKNRALLKENAIEIARLEVQNQFLLFEKENVARSAKYETLHRALQDVFLSNLDLPLNELRDQYAKKTGYPIDLFLISSDYVIYDSTFAPDINLDFKLPYFPDAQASLQKASRVDYPIVGLPTQEVSSGLYKIYSLSRLPNGEFLQIGFKDPAIGQSIRQVKLILESIPNVETVDLFVSHSGNQYLAPFSLPVLSKRESLSKEELLAQVEARLADDKAQFAKLDSLDLVEQLDDSNAINILFFDLGTFDLTETFQYRYLAKVGIAYPGAGWLDRNEKLDLSKVPRLTYEARDLMTTYNHYFDRNLELEEGLRQSAVTDPLTRLFNRSVLPSVHEKLLKIARRNGHNIAALYVDLDYFKQYNDEYGHEAGDQALEKLADIIRQVFQRPADTAVRLGGEEFLIYFEAKDFDNARHMAEQLRETLYDQNISHSASSSEGRLTLSAGLVAIEASTEMGIEKMIGQADEQLYLAKQQGRNRVCARDLMTDVN